MKSFQQEYAQILKGMLGTILLVGMLMPLGVRAAGVDTPLDLATVPLANSPTISIQPNLLFIMDDSGSMAWDFMPDDPIRDLGNYTTCAAAQGKGTTTQKNQLGEGLTEALCLDASFNTVTYNPEIRYQPPAYFTAAGLNTTTYPSQIGMATATGASSASKPNWRQVKNNVYDKLPSASCTLGTGSTQCTNLESRSYFYHTVPGEYCTRRDLKVCVAQSAPTATHPYPAPVRWCNSSTNANAATPAVNSCQASRLTGFTNLRAPTQRQGRIDIDNSNTCSSVTGIIVNGQQIMASSINCSSTENTTAQRILEQINACTYNLSGNCTIAGYSATRDDEEIYITGPTAFSGTPDAPTTTGGSITTQRYSFTKNNVPGERLFVPITSGINSYPLAGSATKASARIDCAASTCTYVEEMTNYANWWAYYRTREQMMKTAASLAFKDIGEDFRIGFMTTSTRKDYMLDFDTFNTSQKASWYSALFKSPADRNTPLRGALSKAGRIYANETTAKRGVFTDPIEYECQQNFTLLTTDGFWNTNDETGTYAGGPLGLDGNNVGNMDSAAKNTPRPLREGTKARADTLADVAKYYYDTDLRDPKWDNHLNAKGQNVSRSPAPSEANKIQRMRTLTLGMGVDGTLAFTPDYNTATTGDFFDIKTGQNDWSDPNPSGNAGPERIDDLWHAAVNGGGLYFSAKNPTDLISQLREALASIEVKVGAGAAAATSTLNPVSGDNSAYVASYTTGHWTGNLELRDIDTGTGAIVMPETPKCVEDVVVSASCDSTSSIVANGSGGYSCVKPDVDDIALCSGAGSTYDALAKTCSVPVPTSCSGTLRNRVSADEDSRNIYMNSGSGLVKFTYSNVYNKLSAELRQTFDPAFLVALTQWDLLTPAQQALVTGENLVNYLRGQTGLDGNAADLANRVFRKRQAVLGDVVNAKPAFIGKPTFNYVDYGYDQFKSDHATRAGRVYVAANDGMLHAFDASTLEEKWAYVPSMVIPNMWKLADTAYDSKHSYYVDGDPVISDICWSGCGAPGATWKTILVGGLNAGGRGYYALDITNPDTPVLLWEFDASNDPDLGYTFGNPVVTKTPDGDWVVLVTSGYNNIPDDDGYYALGTTKFKPNNPPQFKTGDGKGYLYVLDAATGTKLKKISTGAGSTSVPSGLGKITGYAEDAERNNTAEYVYGGDLLGNLWRFDLEDYSVNKLAQLSGTNGPQPITTKPEIGLIKKKRVIFVGTGKYLEVSDLTNTDQQTLYAIRDDGSEVDTGELVQQTMAIVGSDKRESTSNNAVNWDTGYGWYINFPSPGERQHVASSLVLGTLLVPTTVPESSACQPSGYGWLSYFDYRTGLSVQDNNLVSQMFGAPVVGFNVVYIDGKPKVNVVKADDPNPELVPGIPFTGSGSGFNRTRSIWRELVTD